MKPPAIHQTTILVLAFATVTGAVCEEAKTKQPTPLCPLVAAPKEKGLFQLIEVFDQNGKKGVGAPGEKVKIKCTIVNLTKRPLMVAESFITPQYVSIDVKTDDPKEFSEGFPEAKRPLIERSLRASEGVIFSTGVDVPAGWMDWGHIRHWIHIAPSHDLECACCVRHRQYSRTLEVTLPEDDWTSITFDFSQWMPAILLGPEQQATLKSNLQLTIKRSNGERGGDANAKEAAE